MGRLEILSILVMHFTTHAAYGVILRESCLQYGDFNYQKQNAVLQGSVMATFTNKSPKECEAECIDEYFCKSFNTEIAGDKKCELNSASEADKTDDVKVTHKAGWTFMSTSYNEYLVGEYCKAFNSCLPNQLCVDSCQCPGFRCVTCRTMGLGINCLSTNLEIENSALGLEDKTIKDEQFASSSDFKDKEMNRAENARLNQNSAWCAKVQDENQFIQITFDKRMIVSGLAVQGDFQHALWVKNFKVQYSEDRVNWKMYTENNVVKVFPGASDAKQVKKHVLKNYIQAYIIVLRPTEWNVGICFRIEIYGVVDFWWPKGQESAALGLESDTVENSQLSASSSTYYDPPYLARLEGPKRWCAQHSDANQWIKVTFPKRKIITDITVQRGYSSAHSAYIKEYKVKYSECKWQTQIENTAWNIWKEYKENSTPRMNQKIKRQNGMGISLGSLKATDKIITSLPTATHSTRNRQHIKEEFINESLKPLSRKLQEGKNFYDPKQPTNPPGCSKLAEPLGLESGTITNDKMSASSEYQDSTLHAAYLGRLNSQTTPWCAANGDGAAYLQVDLGTITIVAGIASQGHTNPCCFVKTYQIKYAGADLIFHLYPSNAAPKIFDGNTNHAEIVKNEIDPPIRARYIQVVPVTKQGTCMRIELYGCPPTSP